jgi:hypothetical protein
MWLNSTVSLPEPSLLRVMAKRGLHLGAQSMKRFGEAYRAVPFLGRLSVVSRTMPTAVTQTPAIRLGHGVVIGLVAAMTVAATARRRPATMHNQAKS